MKSTFILIPLVLSLPAFAQERRSADTLNTIQLEDATLIAHRNSYRVDSSITVSKIVLKDIENPQVYNSISKSVLKDQVVTNFNNAMKNATGVTRLWESTGRGGDGQSFLQCVGFQFNQKS